jgi:hypothetical protein
MECAGGAAIVLGTPEFMAGQRITYICATQEHS